MIIPIETSITIYDEWHAINPMFRQQLKTRYEERMRGDI
jgi:hypothetical protein